MSEQWIADAKLARITGEARAPVVVDPDAEAAHQANVLRRVRLDQFRDQVQSYKHSLTVAKQRTEAAYSTYQRLEREEQSVSNALESAQANLKQFEEECHVNTDA